MIDTGTLLLIGLFLICIISGAFYVWLLLAKRGRKLLKHLWLELKCSYRLWVSGRVRKKLERLIRKVESEGRDFFTPEEKQFVRETKKKIEEALSEAERCIMRMHDLHVRGRRNE